MSEKKVDKSAPEARKLGAANGRAERARIEAAKGKVFEFEKNNTNRIVLWRCTNGYWKMGGNSALIYLERVCKRFKNNKTPRLVNDTDFFFKFKTGVITIRNIESLEERLKTLNIRRAAGGPKEDYISFSLGYSMDKAEIEKLKHLDRTRREQINSIVATKLIHSDVYAKLKVVNGDIYHMVRKADTIGRELVGMPMVQKSREVMETYYQMTNGELAEKQGLAQMYLGICQLIYRTQEMVEMGLVELSRGLRIGQNLATIKLLINSKQEKLKNE